MKLKYDAPVSKFGFNFKLRHYTQDPATSGCGVLVSSDRGVTWAARAPASLSSAKSAAVDTGGPANTQLGDASVAEVGTGGLLLLLRSRAARPWTLGQSISSA